MRPISLISIKKTLLTALVPIFFLMNANAQPVVKRDTACNFLKHLKFKKGVDTLVFKATYLSLFLLGPFTTYDERFFKKHKIDIHRFSNSELEFQPQDCSKSFSAPLMNFKDTAGLLNADNLGISVIITCVVFEGYAGYLDHSPLVLVIKAVPKKPIGSL
jgi:hypothetical protein